MAGPPLHAAAENGHAGVVGVLVALGACVDARNGYGETALHLAAAYDLIDTVTLLARRCYPFAHEGAWRGRLRF